MKTISKLFIVFLILTMCISLSCVSAQDLNDTDIKETTDNTVNTIDEMETYSFDEFIWDVEDSSGELNLDHDYIDDSDWSDYKSRGVDTFSIEDSVKINGNGHSLDWNHGPVELSIDGNNVELRNMVFKNFNNVSDYSTAISWDGNNGKLENCTFIGNKFYSGLLSVSGNNLIINNCKFINNDGATILSVWNDANVKLTNSEFTNNIVHGYFILWSSEKGTISNNIFKDNKYSSDCDMQGQICFNLIGLYSENKNIVKNNKFLNHGIIDNNGIINHRIQFRYGDDYKFLIVDDDGKPVGENEVVSAKFKIDFYDDEYYSDEESMLITSKSLDYNLKTDKNGYINFNIKDVVEDERIKNNTMMFKYHGYDSAWFGGEFFLNNLSEDMQSSVCSLILEYKDAKHVIEEVEIESSIVVRNVDTFWYSLNVGQFKITEFDKYANYNLLFEFYDSKGNELKNKQVTVKIGGKNYPVTTDKYGSASVNLNLKYGSYQYSVVNPVTSQVLKDSFKVSKLFYGNKNIVKYYKSPTNYKIRILNIDGKPAKKVDVWLTINKAVKKIRTDSNGYATFKLNQKPGKYVVTVEYFSHKVTNKITIKSPIITKNVVKKVKKSGKFTVKVLNSKGKPYAKQTVKVTLNKKTYKVKTNKKGVVSITIPKNLKAGKYTVKTTYNGLTVKNTVTVKK